MNKNEANIIRWILLLPIAGVLLSSFLLTNIFISSKYTKSNHDKKTKSQGANEIKKWKGKLYLVPLVEGKSSSKIISKMK